MFVSVPSEILAARINIAPELQLTKSLFQGLTYLYSSPEEEWAYLAHYVKLMYDTPAGKPYEDLRKLIDDKPYFILTTNVDMQLDKVFPSENICHFQGDMRYRQCQQPCNDEKYANDDIAKMTDDLTDPTLLPSYAVPRCPDCGRVMSLWVRDDHITNLLCPWRQ